MTKLKYIDKIPEGDGESPSLVRGSKVHNGIEEWFKGWGKTLPEEAMSLEKNFAELKKLNPSTEALWAFDFDWKPLADPFSKAAHFRVKTDASLLFNGAAYVFDWKTGKIRAGDYQDAVRLYGITSLLRAPANIKVAYLELWYVDAGKILPKAGEEDTMCVIRKDIPRLQADYTRRVGRLYNERDWPAEVGAHCRWCPYSKYKSGPCTHG